MSTENLDLVLRDATEFSMIDQQIKTLTTRKQQLRDALYGLVEISGEEDDKGNLVYPLPAVCGNIKSLQLQRRVSRGLDSDKAEETLRELGLWDECIEMVPVLNEDKIMAAHYMGKISEEQIDMMYPENESFAFTPVRVK